MAREASAEGVSSREKDEVSEKERARRFTCSLCFRGARHLSLLRPPNPPSHNAGPLARTSDRRPATAQHQALAGVGRAGGADAGGEGYVGGGKKRRACVTGRTLTRTRPTLISQAYGDPCCTSFALEDLW